MTKHTEPELIAEVLRLRATIARVQALPEEWRIRGNEDALGEADAVRGMDTADLRCAAELEAALRGDGGV